MRNIEGIGMKEQGIKTSVVIPVYNTKEYLDMCVDSVLRQTQKEIEIILVDDGSTDGSSEMIKNYAEKYSFVKAVYQENKKLGAARNAGIEIATGKYIYFLDSDDYIQEDLLDRCYQKAEKNCLDFVMFDSAVFVDGEPSSSMKGLENREYDRSSLRIVERVYSGKEFWDKYYSSGGVYPNAVLLYINADFIKNNKIFFEPGVYYEDNDWMIRMYYHAERVSYISQKLYVRRIRVGSIMTSNYSGVHLKSCLVLCEKMLDMIAYSNDIYLKNMIIPVLEMMLMRFEAILKCWNKEEMPDVEPIIILKFYKKLFNMYITFDNALEEIKNIVLIVADTIKRRMEQYDKLVEIPDLGVEEYKKKLLAKDLLSYSLNRKEKTIGIYGSGLVCDIFFELYQNYVGSIDASVFFIDSYRNSGQEYKGYPLYNIKDIEEKNIDCIIIASTRYKEILLENVEKQVKKSAKNIEVFCLPRYMLYFR